MNSERITVLIPTCERSDVLKYSLATCLNQGDAGPVRFLVSDNFSQDNTQSVITNAMKQDSRFKSIRTSKRLGMAEHWEWALKHVADGWVCIIGDDDGLMPNALLNLRQAISRYPELSAINWPYSGYIYPDEKKPGVSGLLFLNWLEQLEIRSTEKWINRLVDFKSAFYVDLPMVYHGLLHTRLLQKIALSVGRQIGTRIPDVFLSIAAAGLIKNYLWLPYPQSINGSSRHSTYASVVGVNDSKVAQHFENDTDIEAGVGIPRNRSVTAMILESILSCQRSKILPADLKIDKKTCLSRIFLEMAERPQPSDNEHLKAIATVLDEDHWLEILLEKNEVELSLLRNQLHATEYVPKHPYTKQLDPKKVSDVTTATQVADKFFSSVRKPREEIASQMSFGERFRYNIKRLRSIFQPKKSTHYPQIRISEFSHLHPELHHRPSKKVFRTKLISQLCRYSTLDSSCFRDWAKQLKEPWRAHRKLWELAFICQALDERGMLASGCKGLGFAVGQEKLPAFFAARGCSITATDLDKSDKRIKPWAETNQWSDSLETLNQYGLCDPKLFQERVVFRAVDMNMIPSDLRDFDFTWSTCSFEHCGSLDLGLQFLQRQMDCLKPGGIAVHTTEFNLSSNDQTLNDSQCVIYRLKDIESICHKLVLQGHTIEPLDLDPGSDFFDRHVDTIPYWDWNTSQPSEIKHLRLNLAGYVSTSIALIIHKAA